MDSNFTIIWENEDQGQVYCGGQYLFEINYDTLGRAGQSALVNAVQTMADLFSVEVNQVWKDYEDE